MTLARLARRAGIALPVLAAAALAFGIARFGASTPARDRAVLPSAASGAPAASGYPGPTPAPATATPAPSGGIYPPPDVDHQIVALEDLPAAPALAALADALEAGDAAALATLAAGEPLALDPLGESEGFGVRLRTAALQALLADLLGPHAAPVVQGAFAPGCLPRDETCALYLVVTGLDGQVAFPTRDPDETIGRHPPATVPTAAAVWELVPDSADGLWWRTWRVAAGYHEAVEALADFHGTYYVLR